MIAFLRQFFFRDVLLKLFSLALAVLVWLIVYIAIQKEGSPLPPLTIIPIEHTFTNMPVRVLLSAEDAHNLKVTPRNVQVTVQGEAKVLNLIEAKDIRVVVDLTGVEAARNLRKRVEVTTPPGASIVRIVPEEVDIVYPAPGP